MKQTMADPYMTLIVGGEKPIGAGKTSLMYHLVRKYMEPPLLDERMEQIRKHIAKLNKLGWTNAKMPDNVQCPVYTIGDSFTSYDSGYDPVTTNTLKFEDLKVPSGKPDEDKKRMLPHTIICIPDLSRFVDSRDSNKDDGPDKQQRDFLALRRKWDLRFFIDGQSYNGIDKRWRQMADCIIEVMGFKHTPGDYFNQATTTWQIRRFWGYKVYEQYLATGDLALCEELTMTHVGDLFGVDIGEEERYHACVDSLAGYEIFLVGDNWEFTATPAEPNKNDYDAVQAKVQLLLDKKKQKKEKSA